MLPEAVSAVALEPAFRAGFGHALAGAQVIQVRLELGDHGQGLQKDLAERVVPVVDRVAEPEHYVLLPKAGQDLAGFGHVAGEPVELRRGQHHLAFVTDRGGGGDRGECVVEPGAVAAGGAAGGSSEQFAEQPLRHTVTRAGVQRLRCSADRSANGTPGPATSFVLRSGWDGRVLNTA